LIRSAKPIVPPLTRLVICVTTASVAPPSANLCKPFLLKNHAADNRAYFPATDVGSTVKSSLIDLPNAV